MSDIKDSTIQQGQAIVLTEVNDNFRSMAAALQRDKGIAITIIQSYLSKYDVADDLRKRVKDRVSKPSNDIKPLLDPNKTMTDIVRENNYDKLENYLNQTLVMEDYEPPLKPDYTSVSGIVVKCSPNKTNVDPRRTGLYIEIGPTDILKSIEVRKWLINNSVLYGFVMYDNNALYYMGVDNIKARLSRATKPQEELRRIVGMFLRSTTSLSLLTKTAQQVINSSTLIQ